MAYKLVNYPQDISIECYQRAIERVVGILKGVSGVISIYQIGSIGNPGISDIDLIVVFKNGVVCDADPLAIFDKKERYLFPHSLFGISEDHFIKIQRFSSYHHFRLLWGQDFASYINKLDRNESIGLKRQIALEFLIANYISRSIEKSYGIINVRTLLLSVRAVKYDLDFLAIQEGKIHDLVQKIIDWRESWFRTPVEQDVLAAWFESFYDELQQLLRSELGSHYLYLPSERIGYARNIEVLKAPELGCKRVGLIFPSAFARFGKKYIRLNNRFNRFRFTIPYSTESGDKWQEKRFLFFKEMAEYKFNYLKNFSVLGGSFSGKKYGRVY